MARMMTNSRYATRKITCILTGCLISWLIGICVPNAVAQQFRIESQVYDDVSSLPVSQNVTLFSEKVVYDFQLSNDAQPTPLEIAIYDTRLRTMTLLDPARQMRLDLPELRLFKILDSVRRETVQDNRTSFLVQDTFSEDVDWSTNWVTLTSPQIEYRFHGSQPKDASILPAYYEFLDNFTKLNASDPTKIPPFARLKLNQSIRRYGWIPSEVQISVKQNSLFRKPFSAKSKHVLMHQLSDQDHERIATAKQNWMHFKSVDLAEYRGLKKDPLFSVPKIATSSHEELSNDNQTGKQAQKR